MSDTIDALIDAVDPKSLVDDALSAGKLFAAEHTTDAVALGADGMEAVMVMAIIKELPAEIQDPDLNIRKMEASQKLLELAADHEERLDKLEAEARIAFRKMVRKVLGRIAGVAMKAALIALV
jgi:hypothetical protein